MTLQGVEGHQTRDWRRAIRLFDPLESTVEKSIWILLILLVFQTSRRCKGEIISPETGFLQSKTNLYLSIIVI